MQELLSQFFLWDVYDLILNSKYSQGWLWRKIPLLQVGIDSNALLIQHCERYKVWQQKEYCVKHLKTNEAPTMNQFYNDIVEKTKDIYRKKHGEKTLIPCSSLDIVLQFYLGITSLYSTKQKIIVYDFSSFSFQAQGFVHREYWDLVKNPLLMK